METSTVMAVNSWVVLSAAITFACAVLGGTYAQGKAASVALEGIARNPAAADKLQTPMILALALIESLVLFGFGIAFLVLQKFGA
jgi:F-type H+-transporting ATPase subunit c